MRGCVKLILKVRTVLRGTVKSVTNVWKIKKIKHYLYVFTCYKGCYFQFGNVVTNSLRMKIFYEFDSVIKVQKLEIHVYKNMILKKNIKYLHLRFNSYFFHFSSQNTSSFLLNFASL